MQPKKPNNKNQKKHHHRDQGVLQDAAQHLGAHSEHRFWIPRCSDAPAPPTTVTSVSRKMRPGPRACAHLGIYIWIPRYPAPPTMVTSVSRKMRPGPAASAHLGTYVWIPGYPRPTHHGDQRVQEDAAHHGVAQRDGLVERVPDVLRLGHAAVLQDDPAGVWGVKEVGRAECGCGCASGRGRGGQNGRRCSPG